MSKLFKSPKSLSKAKLLILGAFLFSLGLGTSAVATSAWYALVEVATVGNLNLQIDMSDAWMSMKLLRNGDLIEDEEGDGYTKEELGQIDTVLGEVSGMFESDWLNDSTNMTAALPRFHSNYMPGHSSTRLVEFSENIYVQNEFIFEAGDDVDIMLDESSFIQANVDANKHTAELLGYDAERAEALNDVVHAVRISFFSEDGYIIANPGESNETYYGGILDLNKDGYYDDIDNKEILYGEYTGEVSYLPGEENETEPLISNRNTFIASHRKGVEKVNKNSPGLTIKKENAYKLQDLKYEENNPLKILTPICHVKKGVQKRVVVSIYVEGWDLHMTDDIASASVDVNIAFTGLIKD